MDDRGAAVTYDPARSLAAVEERVGHPTTPSHLRRMADSARDEARRAEDAAAQHHNRADYYRDLADEREQS